MTAGTRSRAKGGIVRAKQRTKTKERKFDVTGEASRSSRCLRLAPNTQSPSASLPPSSPLPLPFSFPASQKKGRQCSGCIEKSRAKQSPYGAVLAVAIAAPTKEKPGEDREKAIERDGLREKAKTASDRQRERMQWDKWRAGKDQKCKERQRRGETKAVRDERVLAARNVWFGEIRLPVLAGRQASPCLHRPTSYSSRDPQMTAHERKREGKEMS